MKEIVLTQGKSTQIDDTDFEYCSRCPEFKNKEENMNDR